jgi:hypothetical protein
MLRRGLLISGLGLSLTVAGAGVFGEVSALAQDASDSVPAQTTGSSREERRAEWEAERQAQYENFLAKFAENLGISDPAQVETAFKDTLKELIDEQFEAGDISRNAAEEMKTRIDEAELQDIFGFGGFGRGDRMIRVDRHRHGERGLRGSEGPVRIWRDGPHGEFEAGEAMPMPGETIEVEVDSLPEIDEPASTPTS